MSERNLRKTRVGVVVSDKMDKTVVVAVRDSVRHPLYKKIVKRTVKFKAHDEANSCGIGDKVAIMETRRLSADKNWRVVEILEKAKYRGAVPVSDFGNGIHARDVQGRGRMRSVFGRGLPRGLQTPCGDTRK